VMMELQTVPVWPPAPCPEYKVITHTFVEP
jgi:hypothetical protein